MSEREESWRNEAANLFMADKHSPIVSAYVEGCKARYREAIEAAARVAENCRGPSYDGIVHCEEIAQAIRALGEKADDR